MLLINGSNNTISDAKRKVMLRESNATSGSNKTGSQVNRSNSMQNGGDAMHSTAPNNQIISSALSARPGKVNVF